MSVRKYALFALFTVYAAGNALAQDTTAVDTTVTDTTIVDTTGTDTTVTALRDGVRDAAMGLKITGAGFTVALNAETPVTFRLYDVHGRMVWTQTVRPSGGVATVSWRDGAAGGRRFGRGTYLLQAQLLGSTARTGPLSRMVLLGQ